MNLFFRNILIVLLLGFGLSNVKSQTPSVIISILTCSPGDELYSIYGHNAIRVQNLETGSDLVYNYGTFDFDTPGFALKFMRGQLPYLLSVATYDDFLYEYQYYKRSVTEQILNLDEPTTEKIIIYLQINMLPENRAYAYDFFKDNCATRIRDVLEQNIVTLHWDEQKATEKTFRTIIKEYQRPMAWADFGIDLIIGAPADQKTSLSEEMFIPDYLANAISGATLGGASTTQLELQHRTLLEFDNRSEDTPFVWTPRFLFFALWLIELGIFLMHARGKSFKWSKLYDTLWVIILTLGGLLMLFMWFGTNHIPTKYNWNILWANLLIPLWYFYGRRQKWSKMMAMVILGCLLISIVNALQIVQILPQYFNSIIVLISLILLLKGWRIWKDDAGHVNRKEA